MSGKNVLKTPNSPPKQDLSGEALRLYMKRGGNGPPQTEKEGSETACLSKSRFVCAYNGGASGWFLNRRSKSR